MSTKIFYLLLIICCSLASAQTFKIAVFSNLQYSISDKNGLITALIKDLNEQENISKLVFIGNLTNSGSEKELTSLFSILKNSTFPFSVIGGFNDYNKNLFGKDLLIQTFNSDEFIELQSGFLLAGINSIIPDNTANGFVNIESLQNLNEKIKQFNYNSVFVFSNFGLNEIQNKNDVIKIIDNTSLLSFSPTSKTNFVLSKSINEFIELKIPNSSLPENPNYFIIETKDDSIFVYNRKLKNKSTELKTSFALSDLQPVNISSDSLAVNPKLTLTKEIDFKTSSSQPLNVSENKIFTLLDNSLLYRNDFNWNEKFVTEISGRLKSNFVYYKDLLLCGTFDGDFISINSNNGDVLQIVGVGENISSDLTLIDVGSQNKQSKAVVFGTSQGNIFCYDAFTFELLWKNNISKHPVVSKPEFDGDKIFFLNSFSSMYSINAKSGALNWNLEFNAAQNFYGKNFPLSNGKNVFSFTPDNKLIAIDLLLGKINWTVEYPEIIREIYFTSDKQNLILLNNKGVMFFISAKDGRELKKIDFEKSNLFSFKLTENKNKIFVGFSDGSVYSYDDANNIQQLLSNSSVPITSINYLNDDEFVIKDLNGKIKFFKMN